MKFSNEKKRIADGLKKEMTLDSIEQVIAAVEKLGQGFSREDEVNLMQIHSFLSTKFDEFKFNETTKYLDITELKNYHKSVQELLKSEDISEQTKNRLKLSITTATAQYLIYGERQNIKEALEIANNYPGVMSYFQQEYHDISKGYKENKQELTTSDQLEDWVNFCYAKKTKDNEKFGEFLNSNPNLGHNPFAPDTIGSLALESSLDNIEQTKKLIDLTKQQYSKKFVLQAIEEMKESELDGYNKQVIMKLVNSCNFNDPSDKDKLLHASLPIRLLNYIHTPPLFDLSYAISEKVKDKNTKLEYKLQLNQVLVDNNLIPVIDQNMIEQLFQEGKTNEVKALIEVADINEKNDIVKNTQNIDLKKYIFQEVKNYQINDSLVALSLINAASEQENNEMLGKIISNINKQENSKEIISDLLESTQKYLFINIMFIDEANKQNINVQNASDKILLDDTKINKLNPKQLKILANFYNPETHNPNFLVKLIDSYDNDKNNKIDDNIAKSIHTQICLDFSTNKKIDQNVINNSEFKKAITKYLKTSRSVFKVLFRNQEEKLQHRKKNLAMRVRDNSLEILKDEEEKYYRYSYFMSKFIAPIISIIRGEKTSSMLEKYSEKQMQTLISEIKSNQTNLTPKLAAKICNRAVDLKIEIPQELADYIFKEAKAIKILSNVSVNKIAKHYDNNATYSEDFVKRLIKQNNNSNINEIENNITELKAKGIDSELIKKHTRVNPKKFEHDDRALPITKQRLPITRTINALGRK
jgi:hypothetical protein